MERRTEALGARWSVSPEVFDERIDVELGDNNHDEAAGWFVTEVLASRRTPMKNATSRSPTVCGGKRAAALLSPLMGAKALVFISCGQITAAEKKLGKDIVALVEGFPGLQPYFAETVTSLQGLSTNIFRNLEQAAAFVTVMHHRGTVKGRPKDKDRIRASVWIEQEIAIAAFLGHMRKADLPVAAYAQRGLTREGAREAMLWNPFQFDTENEVLADLGARLSKWDLKPYRGDEPSLDVDLGFKQGDRSGDRHTYGLQLKLKNTSALTVPDVEYELHFPKPFIMPHNHFHPHEELADQATKTHRVFIGRLKIDLRPDATKDLRIIGYQVTEDLT